MGRSFTTRVYRNGQKQVIFELPGRIDCAHKVQKTKYYKLLAKFRLHEREAAKRKDSLHDIKTTATLAHKLDVQEWVCRLDSKGFTGPKAREHAQFLVQAFNPDHQEAWIQTAADAAEGKLNRFRDPSTVYPIYDVDSETDEESEDEIVPPKAQSDSRRSSTTAKNSQNSDSGSESSERDTEDQTSGSDSDDETSESDSDTVTE